jgi:hypothetical protein
VSSFVEVGKWGLSVLLKATNGKRTCSFDLEHSMRNSTVNYRTGSGSDVAVSVPLN